MVCNCNCIFAMRVGSSSLPRRSASSFFKCKYKMLLNIDSFYIEEVGADTADFIFLVDMPRSVIFMLMFHCYVTKLVRVYAPFIFVFSSCSTRNKTDDELRREVPPILSLTFLGVIY